MADISLLFDVAMGGGNPSGDSEQLIRSQLEAIVNGINAKPFSIKFQADEASLQQFQKRVSEIAISLGNGAGTSSAAFEQVTRQINIAATAIHTMNGAVNASNLERISTALSGLAGANISDGAIADIVSRLESMSVVLTDARIQFEDLGKTGERVPRLIIEGVDAAGNAIRRNLRFDNKGGLERDLTDITVKLAEVEKASKSSGASTNSSGENAADAFARAKKAVTDYYNALTQLERSGLQNVITQGADGTWSSSQTGYEERVAQLNRLTQGYHNATAARQTFTASQQAEFTEHETARAQQYRVAVEDVARAEQHRQETLRSTVTITRSYDNTIADCQKKLKDWSAAENSRHQSSRDAYDSLRNEVTAAEQARAQYQRGEISIEQYTAAMDRLKSTLISTKATLQQNGDAAKTLSEKLTGLAKKFASWFGVSQTIMYIYRSIRKMVTAVIELDTAMTELKKVTDETAVTYDKFLRNAATRAKRLGASLTDVVNTSADFARLGLSLEGAEVVSDAALVYKNVGDGIEDIDQASESLISTMQAFGIEAKDVMTIVDKFNVAGNNFAISSGGVGDALLNSASALAAANNTLDESIALITAANETIQNPEKVGTALKTLSMYIRAAKTEAEEAGISTEGMANSVSELREEILSLTGNRVDIMIDDDSFKSTYQIIEELSEVWGDLSETTQANITELIGGGVRNANVINALMANMRTASDVIEKTSKSAGSALAENEKVLSSIQGKINVFKATFQEVSQSLFSSEFIKDVVSIGTGLLNILLNIGVLIEKIGGLNNVLIVTAGIIATIKANSIVSFFANIGSKITGIIPAIMSFILKLKDLPLAMRLANVQGKGLSAALNAVGISASAAQIAIGALVAILSIAIISISKYNQKLEETRRNNIDNAKAAKEETDSIRDLIDQYKELARAEKWDETSRDQVKSIQEQITKLVGAQADNLDLVNGKLDEEIKKLDEIALKTAEGKTGTLEVGKKAAEDSLLTSTHRNMAKNLWALLTGDGIQYTINSVNAGAEAEPEEIDAIESALKELDLYDKYSGMSLEGTWYRGLFKIDTSSTDSILQSYNDMIKLQEHLAMNHKEEISTGGNLNDFYNELSERINQMRTAVDDYNKAISDYNENEAIKELGNYLKTNDIDSKEDFDNYINAIRNSTEYSEAYKSVLIKIATDTFPQFAASTDKVVDGLSKAPTAAKDFKSALSEVQSLDTGLGLLDKIYADIYNSGDFDFGSILNNEEFSAAFGDLGGAYDDFIEIVASSPDDIDACRGSFNNLATAYLNNSGVLRDVTDETRDATIAMLKQMGVANAAAIVDASLAKNKELLKYATSEYTSLAYDAVLALYKEAEAGSVAKQALAELAVQKFLTEKNTLTTESDIEQLINLSKAANATERSLMRLNEVKEIMAEAEHLLSLYNTFTYYSIIPSSAAETYLQRYNDLVAKANAILKEPIDYSGMVVDFESVSTDADNAKDSIESLYNAAKNGIEELIDYRKSMLEKDLENQKDAIKEQIDALEDFYDEQREMLEDQYDQEEYLQEQHEKRKAVTDLQGELAMLANDDSAWAQKRKLELQEELSDAEQDLSEFENEHALDEALDMLDDQEERQKELLQSQIDALDEKLNDPYALYNQALTDIKNNTADLYQAMIEYNRKYGSGNDDDVRDMWNDAYESNEDYRDKTGSTYKGIELGNYAGYDASGVGKVSDYSGTLRKGSSGDGVKALQHALNQLGYGNSGTKSLDGSFGSNTRSAVIAFQRANGLSANGIVGSQTKAKFKSLGYAMGTTNAAPGIHAVDELGPEYVFTSGDGTRYRMFTGGEKVLTADATDFLYEFANSGGNILTKMIADLLKMSSLGNIVKPVQAIELRSGDIVVNGSCDSKTVSEIRRAQRSNLNWMLHELNKLNK